MLFCKESGSMNELHFCSYYYCVNDQSKVFGNYFLQIHLTQLEIFKEIFNCFIKLTVMQFLQSDTVRIRYVKLGQDSLLEVSAIVFRNKCFIYTHLHINEIFKMASKCIEPWTLVPARFLILALVCFSTSIICSNSYLA